MTTPLSPSQPLICVVEDEEHIAEGLLFNLQAEGYRTHLESDGDAALAWLLAPSEPPAALLLDVMLPGRDGFSIVRTLREHGLYTPTLMLTARGRAEDVVDGFAAGADDYLQKPFDLNVLLARLAALLRRMDWQRGQPSASTDSPQEFVLDNGRIRFDSMQLISDGNVVQLTLMEADLLRYLVAHAGEVVSRKDLLENVWHVREDTDTRAIDNFIVRLRRYIELDPSRPVHLLTIRGVGYRFVLSA